MVLVFIINMTKRDLKQPSVPAYYRKLAASLNPESPDTPLLASQYLKYADDYQKEEERLLYKWKKASYNRDVGKTKKFK